MKRLVKTAIPELKYAFCDDWLIFAYDKNGDLYYVNTELWPDWAEIPNWKEEAWTPGSVEKYMFPVAKKNWNSLGWRKSDENINDVLVQEYHPKLKNEF